MNVEFIQKLLALYPRYNKVYGPYKRKDGRKHLVLCISGLSKGDPEKLRTVSYPKALVEVRDNRLLLDNETVDHADNDFTNDELPNLVIRDRVEHIKLDAKRFKYVLVKCVQCGNEFEPTVDQRNSKRAGPFCNRVCTGIYGTSIQNGGYKLDRVRINKEYYTLKRA